MNEVWRLVTSGVLSVRDIDSVMSDGLGMRYAFLGPLETTHLNAEGFVNYCDRYNKSIYDVSQSVDSQLFFLLFKFNQPSLAMLISLFMCGMKYSSLVSNNFKGSKLLYGDKP